MKSKIKIFEEVFDFDIQKPHPQILIETLGLNIGYNRSIKLPASTFKDEQPPMEVIISDCENSYWNGRYERHCASYGFEKPTDYYFIFA